VAAKETVATAMGTGTATETAKVTAGNVGGGIGDGDGDGDNNNNQINNQLHAAAKETDAHCLLDKGPDHLGHSHLVAKLAIICGVFWCFLAFSGAVVIMFRCKSKYLWGLKPLPPFLVG
jgi:hypothetical protein